MHPVELDDFWIGKTQVTQKQWQAIMGNNPSHFKGENLPVESVSWNDCQEFLQKLNEKLKNSPLFKGGQGGFKLPSEAQWEYAARGGNQSKNFMYAGSNNLDEVAWYWQNSGDKWLDGDWDHDKITRNNGRTHEVGKLKANELGIYDMSGNVWEWCEDGYDAEFYKSAEAKQRNPINNRAKEKYVLRGGSWINDPLNLRVTFRDDLNPTLRYLYYGFRFSQVR